MHREKFFEEQHRGKKQKILQRQWLLDEHTTVLFKANVVKTQFTESILILSVWSSLWRTTISSPTHGSSSFQLFCPAGLGKELVKLFGTLLERQLSEQMPTINSMDELKHNRFSSYPSAKETFLPNKHFGWAS